MSIEKEYQLAIDELNVIVSESMRTREGKKKAAEVTDDILSILVEAYLLGLYHASKMMSQEVSVNMVKMQNVIYQNIEGKTFAERAAEHINNGNEGRLESLVESEFHRIYNTAVEDGVRETGRRNVTKTWLTVRDNRVRETHQYLEGISVPMSEDFYTFDGDHAPFPGGFEKPENNINCRCILRYRSEP